jgi:hypothetical protein
MVMVDERNMAQVKALLDQQQVVVTNLNAIETTRSYFKDVQVRDDAGDPVWTKDDGTGQPVYEDKADEVYAWKPDPETKTTLLLIVISSAAIIEAAEVQQQREAHWLKAGSDKFQARQRAEWDAFRYRSVPAGTKIRPVVREEEMPNLAGDPVSMAGFLRQGYRVIPRHATSVKGMALNPEAAARLKAEEVAAMASLPQLAEREAGFKAVLDQMGGSADQQAPGSPSNETVTPAESAAAPAVPPKRRRPGRPRKR